MKTIKVVESTGRALNFLVAKAEGMAPFLFDNSAIDGHLSPDRVARMSNRELCILHGILCSLDEYGYPVPIPDYFQDREVAGEIIERENIGVVPAFRAPWTASKGQIIGALWPSDGGTILEAGLRCYCRSILGDETEVPDELLGEAKKALFGA